MADDEVERPFAANQPDDQTPDARDSAASLPPQQAPYTTQRYPAQGDRGYHEGPGYTSGSSASPAYQQQGYSSAAVYAPTSAYPPPSAYHLGSGGQPADPSGPDTGPARDSGAANGTARRSWLGAPLLITAVIAALVGGGVGAATVAIADRHNDSVNTGLKITNDTGAPAAQTDGTISAAAAKIRPSVVTIDVTGSQQEGTGSGVIIRDDGYILTNDHVVSIAANGGTIRVILSDGRTATATIAGRDSSDDLAVVKIAGMSNLAAATFGTSGNLTVGQTVVAIGAPLGLSDTVTSGIVSNAARPVRAGDNAQAVFEAIQTDAAINPGNSGGPLVDLRGSVVGINAAIATDSSGGGLQIPGQTQSSGNIGIGFAIPSDEASRIASELIANGKAYHAVIGVSVSLSSNSSTPTATGVTISAVDSGGPAAKGGLKAGDVVTGVGQTRVSTADALIAAIRSHAPGSQVTVSYTRGGKVATATVTLGKSDT
jgi:putative serine protease PepD